MLMAMQPIWESDFHRLSYGFRPERSVHHAIRTVKSLLVADTAPRPRGSLNRKHSIQGLVHTLTKLSGLYHRPDPVAQTFHPLIDQPNWAGAG
jgi:hypothetical protein